MSDRGGAVSGTDLWKVTSRTPLTILTLKHETSWRLAVMIRPIRVDKIADFRALP